MPPTRSIVVTGGASGIGLGITRHFASATSPSQPMHVTILDINATTGQQTIAELQSALPNASISFEQCDVSSWESQAAAFERIYATQGRIDVVFANAGITEKGELVPKHAAGAGSLQPEKPDLRTLEVNLIGVIYTVKLAIYYISKNEPYTTGAAQNGDAAGQTLPISKGCIICTASNAGIYPFPIAPVYATAKHGVVGLVRSLALPLEKEKIRINGLAPSVIQTNIAGNLDLFKSMILTPMSTATRAASLFVDDASLTGKIAELHGEHVTFAEPPDYVDEDSKTNLEMFWTLGYA